LAGYGILRLDDAALRTDLAANIRPQRGIGISVSAMVTLALLSREWRKW